ncbi:hypothetical protein DPMN_016876 [Dreissena polymorpha]|uniref:CCHC-type domain-containing protein n=1 Tax=Dreissena polymorpha TaxID=45954 RepID=A0A9D4NDV6_DREPO|nr:hypothetical protein DPMN_016876 [Dreissena polymorpha]
MRERIIIVLEATEERRILDPEALIRSLMTCGEHEYDQRQALLGQVDMVRRGIDGEWLSNLAGSAFRMGFAMCSEAWIERHITTIPDWARSSSVRPPCRYQRREDSSGGGACGHTTPIKAPSNSRTSKDAECWTGPIESPPRGDEWREEDSSGGASGGAHFEVPSTSRTSDDEESLTVAGSPKKARGSSPLNWEETEVVIDRGCFKCGDKGHWSRESENDWLCHRCGEQGHVAKYCPGRKWVAPKMVVEWVPPTSCETSTVPRVEERPTTASTSRSNRAEEQPAARRTVAPNPEVEVAGPKGDHTFKKCPVFWCMENFHYRKAHVFGHHYPTALAREHDPGSEARRARIVQVRVIVLRYLTTVVVGPEATVEDLVRYLNNGRLMGREKCTVDEWTRQVAVEVAEELRLPIPEVFTCVPLNSPGVIFQYRIMLEIMGLLTLQQHEEFLFQFSSAVA